MFNAALRITIVVALVAALPAAGKDSATFRATVEGEISGGPQAHVNSITSATNQVVIRLMPMDLSLFGERISEGSACFWQARYEGPLTVERDKKGNAISKYYFTARARDSVTEVKYLLDMKGLMDDVSNWLPVPGTAVYMNVSDWSVAAESKGQGRAACSGSGTLNATTILIERLP
jgi:hypothetical protein